MKRFLPFLISLTLALFSGQVFAGTSDLSSGATSSFQVPLYNPSGAASSASSYGRYPLSDLQDTVFDSAGKAQSLINALVFPATTACGDGEAMTGFNSVTGAFTCTPVTGSGTGYSSFAATGDATGTVSLDGSNNATLALTLSSTGVSAGSYGTSSAYPTFTVDAKGRLTASGSVPLGNSAFLDYGTAVGDLPRIEQCSVQGYYTSATCVTAGGTWESTPFLPFGEVIDTSGFTGNLASSAPTSLQGLADAIDSLSLGGTPTAASVTYDHTASGLSATNLQSAVDELKAAITSSSSGYVSPPAYTDSTGTTGQYSGDSNYFYLATSTNHWKRVAWDGTWTATTPDTTNPSIAFVDSSPITYGSSPQTVTGTASDNVAVSSVACAYNGGSSTAATDTSGNSSWSNWSYSVTPLDDATSHNLVCTATDSSSNTVSATLAGSYDSGGGSGEPTVNASTGIPNGFSVEGSITNWTTPTSYTPWTAVGTETDANNQLSASSGALVYTADGTNTVAYIKIPTLNGQIAGNDTAITFTVNFGSSALSPSAQYSLAKNDYSGTIVNLYTDATGKPAQLQGVTNNDSVGGEVSTLGAYSFQWDTDYIITVVCIGATGASTADGGVYVFVNGTLVTSKTGIQNYTYAETNYTRLGMLYDSVTTSSGQITYKTLSFSTHQK